MRERFEKIFFADAPRNSNIYYFNTIHTWTLVKNKLLPISQDLEIKWVMQELEARVVKGEK